MANTGFRIGRSVSIKISEARGIPKSCASAFCELWVDSKKYVGKTNVKWKEATPFWGEEFNVTLEEEDKQLVIIVKDGKKKKPKDGSSEPLEKVIGMTSLDFSSLKPGKLNERWHLLQHSHQEYYHTISSSGTIHIKKSATNQAELKYAVKLEQTTILAAQDYDRLLKILFDDDFHVIFNFCEQKTLSTQDRADLAVSLCHITEYLGLAPYFITKLITKEIKKTDKKEVLFRGNSVATKMLDYYMKMVGKSWIKCLDPFIATVTGAEEYSCELAAAKVGPLKSAEHEDGVDLHKNYINLRVMIIRALNIIFKNARGCPNNLKIIFSNIVKAVKYQFPNNFSSSSSTHPPSSPRKNSASSAPAPLTASSRKSIGDFVPSPPIPQEVHYTAVSGFVFLRFFVAAIMTPKLFGLMTTFAEDETNRNFILVATVLQKLGNFQLFDKHEPYFYLLNEDIISFIPQMKEYIDSITNVDIQPNPNQLIISSSSNSISSPSQSPSPSPLSPYLYLGVSGGQPQPPQNQGSMASGRGIGGPALTPIQVQDPGSIFTFPDQISLKKKEKEEKEKEQKEKEKDLEKEKETQQEAHKGWNKNTFGKGCVSECSEHVARLLKHLITYWSVLDPLGPDEPFVRQLKEEVDRLKSKEEFLGPAKAASSPSKEHNPKTTPASAPIPQSRQGPRRIQTSMDITKDPLGHPNPKTKAPTSASPSKNNGSLPDSNLIPVDDDEDVGEPDDTKRTVVQSKRAPLTRTKAVPSITKPLLNSSMVLPNSGSNGASVRRNSVATMAASFDAKEHESPTKVRPKMTTSVTLHSSPSTPEASSTTIGSNSKGNQTLQVRGTSQTRQRAASSETSVVPLHAHMHRGHTVSERPHNKEETQKSHLHTAATDTSLPNQNFLVRQIVQNQLSQYSSTHNVPTAAAPTEHHNHFPLKTGSASVTQIRHRVSSYIPNRPSSPSESSSSYLPRHSSQNRSTSPHASPVKSSFTTPTPSPSKLASSPSPPSPSPSPSGSPSSPVSSGQSKGVTLSPLSKGPANPGDNHKCFKCLLTITNSAPGLQALNRYYHNKCFSCVSCFTPLASHPFYEVQSEAHSGPYCHSCAYVLSLPDLQ